MKTFSQLLENFKTDIKNEIQSYQDLFSERKPMSEQRAKDVKQLLILTEEENHNESLKECIRHVLNQFKTGFWIFQTGRSRLKNSVLSVLQKPEYTEAMFHQAELEEFKQNYLQETQLFQQENTNFLYESDVDLDSLKEQYLEKIEKLTLDVPSSELQAKLETLKLNYLEDMELLQQEKKDSVEKIQVLETKLAGQTQEIKTLTDTKQLCEDEIQRLTSLFTKVKEAYQDVLAKNQRLMAHVISLKRDNNPNEDLDHELTSKSPSESVYESFSHFN